MKKLYTCAAVVLTLLLMDGCQSKAVTIHKECQGMKNSTISESLMTKMRSTQQKSQADQDTTESETHYSAAPKAE